MKMQSLKCFRNAAWIERFMDCMCSRGRYVRKCVTADVIINENPNPPAMLGRIE